MSNRNAVFVLDAVARGAERYRNPCNRVHPATARKFLSHGSSAVFRQYPFTIIWKPIMMPLSQNSVRC